MSFHVLPKRRAEARRLAEQRRAVVSSILVSIFMMISLLLILLMWFLPVVEKEPDVEGAGVRLVRAIEGNNVQGEKKAKPMRYIRRKPRAPAYSVARSIAAETDSAFSIPRYDDVLSKGNGLGGESGGGGEISGLLGGRCSQLQRSVLLNENGGNPACELAVLRSLRWLKSTQNEDGSWCDENQVAMTGLALLSYLGHCETSQSEQFGESVTRAIVYLVDLGLKNTGKLSEDLYDDHWCYDHAIATYALGEAVVLCKAHGVNIPRLEDVVKLAGDWILDHQHDSGGWDYGYDCSSSRGGDNSITLWQLQALKACQQSGLWKDCRFSFCVNKSLSYLEKGQLRSGGVGYFSSRKGGYQSMIGGAMLAYQMWGIPIMLLSLKVRATFQNHLDLTIEVGTQTYIVIIILCRPL